MNIQQRAAQEALADLADGWVSLADDALQVAKAAAAQAGESDEWVVAYAMALQEAKQELRAKAAAFRADPANRNSLAIFQSPESLRALGYI